MKGKEGSGNVDALSLVINIATKCIIAAIVQPGMVACWQD